jgi:hypothetical protein
MLLICVKRWTSLWTSVKETFEGKPGFLCLASLVPRRKRCTFAKHPRLSKQTIRQRLPETTLLVFDGTEIPPFLCSSFAFSNWLPSVVIPSKITENLFLRDVESGRNCHLLLHCLNVKCVNDVSFVVPMPHGRLRWSTSFCSVPDHESHDLSFAFAKAARFEKSVSLRQDDGNLLLCCIASVARHCCCTS